MKKGNLIKLPHLSISHDSHQSHHPQNDQEFNSQAISISQELETAIQLLIHQLRDFGPICSRNK
jgi:hypothetical protein